ncbi:O-antigen ligase family protein [Humisphaera borealis]|uniref:O-antigen ligase family protein n=1 Tax=Humisphaera borealis TaxID=2807512 RepID=A0A7M2WTQ1_9BACT|nr:O-antigen ligase family protein [Humisphaera borealis]QOV88819.1 O-antigen ligase family protein [Humisphaera borealis]
MKPHAIHAARGANLRLAAPSWTSREFAARFTRTRFPAPERLYLFLALMISGTVTLPQVVEFGGISGLGFWTIAAAAVTWGLWFLKPHVPTTLLRPLLPLGVFTLLACVSPLWGRGFDSNAIQLLAVIVAFAGFILLCARETANQRDFAEAVGVTLDFAAVTAGLFYTFTLLTQGIGGELIIGGRPVFLARPFALFAIIAVARQIARFHAGQKAGLAIAIWLTVLVVLSHSRLGMVTLLAMYPVSYALLGGRKNLGLAVLMLVGGGLAFAGLLLSSDEMYQRFFGYDASLQVGGVAINASGRTAAWQAMLNDIRNPLRLWFGAGAGAGSAFCQANFQNLPHPHNDYLRYLYDIGIFGLAWFMAFLAVVVVMLWRRIMAARYCHDPVAFSLNFGTLLSVAGVGMSMFTDNSANYIYVMAPLGILIGATLGKTVSTPKPVSAVKFQQQFRPEPIRPMPRQTIRPSLRALPAPRVEQ